MKNFRLILFIFLVSLIILVAGCGKKSKEDNRRLNEIKDKSQQVLEEAKRKGVPVCDISNLNADQNRCAQGYKCSQNAVATEGVCERDYILKCICPADYECRMSLYDLNGRQPDTYYGRCKKTT